MLYLTTEKRKIAKALSNIKNAGHLSSTEDVNRTCSGQSAKYFSRRHSQPFSFIPPDDFRCSLSAEPTQIQQLH